MKKIYSNLLSVFLVAVICLSMALPALAAQLCLDYKTNGDDVVLLVSTLTQITDGNEIEVVLSTDGKRFAQVSCSQMYILNGTEISGSAKIDQRTVSLTFKNIVVGQSIKGITAEFNGLSNTECSLVVKYKDKDGNILKTESDVLCIVFKGDTPNELPSRSNEGKTSNVKSDIILAGTPNIKQESTLSSVQPVTTLKGNSENVLSEREDNEVLSEEAMSEQTSSDTSASAEETLSSTENETSAVDSTNNNLQGQKKLLVICLGLVGFAIVCAILVAIITASKKKKGEIKEEVEENKDEGTQTDIDDDFSDE